MSSPVAETVFAEDVPSPHPPSPPPRLDLPRQDVVPPPRGTSLRRSQSQHFKGSTLQPDTTGETSAAPPPPLNKKKSQKFKGVSEEDRMRFAELLERDKDHIAWPSADDVRAKVLLPASLSKLIFQFTEAFNIKIKSLEPNRKRSTDKTNGSPRSLPGDAQQMFVGALELLWVQELRRYFQRIVQLENYGGLFPPLLARLM